MHPDSGHPDFGVGPNRFAAHRFYLRMGFDITSHHFEKDVWPGSRTPPGGRGAARIGRLCLREIRR
jgi:hypothetical protein